MDIFGGGAISLCLDSGGGASSMCTAPDFSSTVGSSFITLTAAPGATVQDPAGKLGRARGPRLCPCRNQTSQAGVSVS